MSIFHKSSLSLGGLLDAYSETFQGESQSKLVSLKDSSKVAGPNYTWNTGTGTKFPICL